jgi:lysophospholipase L1-like esterase
MNICIFGDSITWGGYDPEQGGWATLLRNYLEEKFNDVTTYNLGICADDSKGLLNRLKTESTPRQPDVIIIAIGANDIKHQPSQPVSYDQFINNITHILNQAKEITPTVVVVGITPVDEKFTTPSSKPPHNFRKNKDIDICNQMLEDLAGKHHFTYVPVPKDFSPSDLADGIHPNTSGHQKLFNAIKPVIESLI